MEIKKFRKKPVIIEAIQFKGTNYLEVAKFLKKDLEGAKFDRNGKQCVSFSIYTLEGVMKVEIGDWVIKGVKGEYYPCKPDIFKKSYEEVKEHWQRKK